MISKLSLVGASVLVAVLTAAGPSLADSGIQKGVCGSSNGGTCDVEVIGQMYLVQRAGHDMWVEVTEPNTSGECADFPNVVLDVFSTVDGTLIGHGSYWYKGEGFCFNAHVTIPAVSKQRNVLVIVRGTPNSGRQSQVPVSASEADGDDWRLLNHFDIVAGPRIPTGSLLANTFIQTVEEPGGTNDTLLMVMKDEVPIAIDDNSGVDWMSFISLPSACVSPGCSILPARRGHALATPGSLLGRLAPNMGAVTVVWDEGAYNHRADKDKDGLGDALEVALGTCTDLNNAANDKDTDGDGTRDCEDDDVDGDGVPDSYEVLGKADESGKQNMVANLTKFPYYGADPLKQDLFVEVDWFPKCTDPRPSECSAGHTGESKYDKDEFQVGAQTAHHAIQRFSSNIRVHMDIGSNYHDGTNWSPDAAYGKWGSWGGAHVLPDSTSENYSLSDVSSYLSSARKGLFILLISDARKGGVSRAYGPGRFNSDARNCVHETGHALGLGHWGEWSGKISGKANCKPNYISVMNYATNESALIGGGGVDDLPAFSSGRYCAGGGTTCDPLNPSSMNESTGLTLGGTASSDTNPKVLDVMERVYLHKVDPKTGGIDWDQDGVIQPAGGPPVRAFINRYASEKQGAKTGGCDPDPTGAESVGIGKVSTLVATSAGPKIHMMGSSFGASVYSVGCAVLGLGSCETWSTWSTGSIAAVGAALLRPKTMTAAGDFIVYEDEASHHLHYVGRSPDGKGVAGLLGGPAVAGPPTAIVGPNTGIGVDGRIRVYAPVTTSSGGTEKTTLRLWEYDLAKDVWVTVAAEQYRTEGAGPIEMVPGTGVGLTVGFRSDVSGPQLFAAIPSLNSDNGKHELLFAMLRESELTWTMPLLVNGVLTMWTPTLTLDRWEVLPKDAWGLRGDFPAADVGRVGLAFLPADPKIWNDPKGGRFYVSWQSFGSAPAPTDDNPDPKPRAVALISFTRGNVWPLTAGAPGQTGHGLYFMGDSVFSLYNTDGDDWPEGMVLAASGGRVLGLGGPGYRYFPNADGAINQSQMDHDDASFIRKNLSCAIRGCGSLSK